VIVTSDNPRGENPAAIAAAVAEGSSPKSSSTAGRRFAVPSTKRAPAIRWSLPARPRTYQIIGEERLPFDDRDEVRSAFSMRSGALRA